MSTEGGVERLGPPGTPELDELQRGHEKPITVENLERGVPIGGAGRRQVPIPHPGERRDAIRFGTAGPEPPAEPGEEK